MTQSNKHHSDSTWTRKAVTDPKGGHSPCAIEVLLSLVFSITLLPSHIWTNHCGSLLGAASLFQAGVEVMQLHEMNPACLPAAPAGGITCELLHFSTRHTRNTSARCTPPALTGASKAGSLARKGKWKNSQAFMSKQIQNKGRRKTMLITTVQILAFLHSKPTNRWELPAATFTLADRCAFSSHLPVSATERLSPPASCISLLCTLYQWPLAKILAPSPWVRYRKESIEMSPRCCDCCRLCPLATVGSAPSAQDQLLHASGKTIFKTECIKHVKVKGVIQWTLKLRPRQECEHCESIRFTGSSKLRDCEDCSSEMFPKVTCLFAYKWQTNSSGATEYCNSDCIQETLCKSSWYFWW